MNPRLSDESILGQVLLEWFLSREWTIHAWHPPSSKAYFGPLIRIPRTSPDKNSSNRYHLDGVVQLGSYMLLVEIKGRCEALTSDAAKLRELMTAYSMNEIKALMRRRVRDKEMLDGVLHWYPALGCVSGHQATTKEIHFNLDRVQNALKVTVPSDLPPDLTSRLIEIRRS